MPSYLVHPISQCSMLTSRQKGNCKPAEKLNKTWCFRQFYNMCRNGRKNGSAVGAYGGGGCQRWMIFQKGYYKPT